MATTIELTATPLRDPSALTYIDVAGVEPVAVFAYGGVWLLRFATDLTNDQIANVRARAQGSATEDQLRKDVLNVAPALSQIIGSTGTLTAAQLSDAARANAKATYALGRLVLDQLG